MNANVINSEYLMSKDNKAATDYDQISVSTSSTASKLSKLGGHVGYLLLKMRIDDNSKMYKIWDYLTSVHIASISSIVYSFIVVMLKWQYKTLIAMRITSALLDIYFLIRIYVYAHVIYKDPSSGIIIKDLKLIRKRYFCSITRFWLELLTIFPFEYMLLLITDDTNIVKYGYTARVFRCLFMYKYYTVQKENLNVRHHLRLTYLMYRVLFGIEWAACIWYVLCTKL